MWTQPLIGAFPQVVVKVRGYQGVCSGMRIGLPAARNVTRDLVVIRAWVRIAVAFCAPPYAPYIAVALECNRR
jgi:hypothetical protein